MIKFVVLAALVHLLAVWGFTRQVAPVLFAVVPLVIAAFHDVRSRADPRRAFFGMTIVSAVSVGAWWLWKAAP
jgi:hypothetical protein